MRTSKFAIRVARPRNRVLRALVRGLLRIATGFNAPGPRRRADLDRLDLDQRVREVGEW